MEGKFKQYSIMIIPNTINIDWFGNRPQYEISELKIVTVGLNPSGIEFGVDKTNNKANVDSRFPACHGKTATFSTPGYFPDAWNHYFDNNPYWKWFDNFEHVLWGLNASYKYDKKHRALHTDLCTPWATSPTWSKLSPIDRETLSKQFKFDEWKNLVKGLKPDIIIACIPQEYRLKLGYVDTALTKLCEIQFTKSGNMRKHPIPIYVSKYNGAIIVFGRTMMVPFGNISNDQKIKVGQTIMVYYECANKNNWKCRTI